MGLKENNYIGSEELISFIKLGCLCSESDDIIEGTTNKDWRKRIKMAVTNLKKVIDERVALLSREQYYPVLRRKNNSKMVLVNGNLDLFRKSQAKKDIVKVSRTDIYDLAELALNSCNCACEQGECVRTCRFRILFHRLGIPVLNVEPCKGKCEFVTINEKENDKNENEKNDGNGNNACSAGNGRGKSGKDQRNT